MKDDPELAKIIANLDPEQKKFIDALSKQAGYLGATLTFRIVKKKDGTRVLKIGRTKSPAGARCPECGAPWHGEYCSECRLFAPCPRCGARTEVGGGCPACGGSIFEEEGAS